MKLKQLHVMLVMVNTLNGLHSLSVVLPAKEELSQDTEAIPARLERQRQLPATPILAPTTNGLHGQLARKLAAEVCNQEDEATPVGKMIKPKIKHAIQIQGHTANGLLGANVLLHAGVDLKPEQEYTHAQERLKLEHKCVTHTHAQSGVDGHSGVFAVQHVMLEPG